MNNTPSTEDRVWAVLSHLSALAFGLGILLPVVGWADQRRKSKYSSFQCLQALGYQSLGYTVWILLSLVLILVLIFSMIPAILSAEANGGDVASVISRWMIVIFIAMIGFIGLYILFPIIAAISSALGRDYRYPILGNRLARYLNYDSANEAWINEDHEDRWVTAMGHFSVIISLWGILVPLTAWMLQGKRSLFLKFQALQTIAFQALATLLPFVAIMLYLFGFFVFIVMTGIGADSSLSSSMGIAGLIILLGSMLIAVGIACVVPLFHILGQYAGYRVLKGDDFRYPVIGRSVEKRLAPSGSQTPMEPE